MRFWIITTFLINLFFLSPAISSCPSVDYSNRFGPIRDQDGMGLCWAFATAALFEEQNCKNNPDNCGKSLSPLDASRCGWSYGLVGKDQEQGNYLRNAISCVLENGGVCPEVNSPFGLFNNLECFFTHQGRRERCNIAKINELYEMWKSSEQTHQCFLEAQEGKDTFDLGYNIDLFFFTNIIFNLTFPPSLLQGRTVTQLMNDSVDSNDFLKKLFETPQCVQNRMTSNTKLKILSSYPDGMISYIKSILTEKGSSAAVSINLAKLDSDYKDPSNHSLLVVGMRENPVTKECEVKLRNSWGVGASYNNWYPIEKFKMAINEVDYLYESK